MKKILFSVLSFLCALLSLAQTPPQKTYAVVVGIASYENPAIKGLQYANKDAQFFADWVGSAKGGKVPRENLRVLLNEEATVAAIYNALEWLKETCQTGDQAYIYFSGHGDIETRNNNSKGYLLAYNTPPNNYPNNAISVGRLNEDANYLTLQKKTQVCIITDACHSGKLAGDFFKGKQWVAEQLQQVLHSEVRMAACAADQLAAEGEFWDGGRGVFSYHLLRGLYGLADKDKDGQISFEELQQYLKTAFQNDPFLKVLEQKQTPVTDGNPLLVLSQADTAFLSRQTPSTQPDTLPQSPMDYFFGFAKDYPLESIVAFDSLPAGAQQNLGVFLVEKCIAQDSIDHASDYVPGNMRNSWFQHPEQLKALLKQLQRSKSLSKSFQERFVELVQTKAQAMINAYLNGEEAELEKRQYYYSGARNYNDFLPMVKLAMGMVPARHHLSRVLEVDFHYLSGVLARLNMAVSKNTDGLLKRAFQHQYRTQALEPYAAYVENELANLYVHLKKFDSAQYHFDLAVALAKTWAIPWSNQIRMNLMTNDLAKANRALQVADSLQPNLSYVYMNGGILKEREKKPLEAISFYRRALQQNAVHFLPHERLGHLYLQAGDYPLANAYFVQAEGLKKNFSINQDYFKFGVELGGENSLGMEEAFVDSCQQQVLAESQKQTPWGNLLRALNAPPGTNSDSLLAFYQSALRAQPHLPLAHHNLAKIYLQRQQYALAIPVLKEAIRHYASDSVLYATALAVVPTRSTASCVAGFVRSHQYDQREDLYWMAKALEAENRLEEALAYYEQASLLENQALEHQAQYKDFEKVRQRLLAKMRSLPQPEAAPQPVFRNQQPVREQAPEMPEGMIYFMDEFFNQYEVPVKQTAAVQRMRVHEKLQQFQKAEQALLDQVKRSRQAGYLREATLNKGLVKRMKPFDRTNSFWVNANRELEIAVHDFYLRRIQQEPRNFYWKQQAALFLYHRLALAYEQMPQDFYPWFTADFVNHAYPWEVGESSYGPQEARWPIPGWPDTLVITTPAFHPVETALDFAEKAQELSPNRVPDFASNQMLADLNNWMGNETAASTYYEQALRQQSPSQPLRRRYYKMLMYSGNHKAAFWQLDTLLQKGPLAPDERLQLAFFTSVEGQYGQAQNLLKGPAFKDIALNMQRLVQTAHLFYQQKNYAAATKLLLNQFPPLTAAQRNSADSNIFQEWTNVRFYLLAKTYAAQNQAAKALLYLKKSQEKTFDLSQVIVHDPAWAPWKKGAEKKWFDFIQSKADESLAAGEEKVETFINPLDYYIPGQAQRNDVLPELYKYLKIK